MRLTELASELARREGGRRQAVNVAQSAEHLRHLGDVLLELGCEDRQRVVDRLLEAARRRNARRGRGRATRRD